MKFFLRLTASVFLIITPLSANAEMNIFKRLLYSNESYANQIEVKAFIITPEQAHTEFCNPSKEILQLKNKGLFGKNTYLFLQIRNNGNKYAWGTLACKVPTYHEPIQIPIVGLNTPDKYSIYLFHLGSILIVNPNDMSYPKISFEWAELYTK